MTFTRGAAPAPARPAPTAEAPPGCDQHSAQLDLSGLWAQQSTPGQLVVVCGFDGSGKSTQVDALRTALEAVGRPVQVTRQPTSWYRQLPEVRTFLDAGGRPTTARRLALLAAADRLRHVEEEVLPRLREGCTVITDRYVFSSIAYFLHRRVPWSLLAEINHGIPRPDLAVYLDVPPAALTRRLAERDGEAAKFEERSQERIAAVTEKFARMRDAFMWLDGEAPAEMISARVRAALGLAREAGTR